MPIDFSVTRERSTRHRRHRHRRVHGRRRGSRSRSRPRRLSSALGFEGKPGQACVVAGASGATRVALGLGKKGETTVADVRKAAGAFVRAAGRFGSLATGLVETAGVDAKAGAQAVVEGATLGSYSFGRFKSDKKHKQGVESFALMTPERAAKATQTGIDRGAAVAQAVSMARDLVNTPGGSLNARDMADLAMQLATECGLEVEVMDEHAMQEAGLGGMLGVNRGSEEPPRLIKLTYTPRNPSGSIALVGKGIMFDSGGLSLKSGEGMMSMKIDMSGAAAVLATMSVLKATRPRAKVIGFLCCTDNMPSGRALKPGDVITIRNGKTVEVLNTDAEGRLVLADGLSLAVEEDVDAIIDLATLTGAVVGALGNRIAGVMGNDDALMGQVRDAAARADELVWPLPLPVEYRRLIDSPVADIKNIGGTSVLGSGGGGGGAAHRGPLPEGVCERCAVGAHRPGRPCDVRCRRHLRVARWHRVRRAHARRAARPVQQAREVGRRARASAARLVAPHRPTARGGGRSTDDLSCACRVCVRRRRARGSARPSPARPSAPPRGRGRERTASARAAPAPRRTARPARRA